MEKTSQDKARQDKTTQDNSNEQRAKGELKRAKKDIQQAGKVENEKKKRKMEARWCVLKIIAS